MARKSIIATLSALIVPSAICLAQLKDVTISSSDSLSKMHDARRAEFEPRYDYANWPGRDGPALQLGRFDPSISLGDVEFSAVPIDPWITNHYSMVGLCAAINLVPIVQEQPDERAVPICVTFRFFSSPASAHDAFMDRVSSPLFQAPPSDPPQLPWGEVWVKNIGDVCFLSGRDEYECFVGNVWFTIGVGRPPEGVFDPSYPHPPRIRNIAAAFCQKLRHTDAAVRAGGPGPQSSVALHFAMVDRALTIRDGYTHWKSVQLVPASEITLDSEGWAHVALVRPFVYGAPTPVFEQISISGGTEVYGREGREEVRRREDEKVHIIGVGFSAEDIGPQTVRTLAQYPDGSFELTQATITVREK